MSVELYHERMLRLARAGDGEARLAGADATVTLDNPLCGDRVTLDLRCGGDGRVVEIGHAVRGCVLCRAAAAVLAGHAAGLSAADIEAVRRHLRAALRGEGPAGAEPPWEELSVFAPVAPHKSRHACVLLPFDAALEALGQS